MKAKKSIVLATIFLLLTLFAHAEKRALIIAVGDYDKETRWPSISSENDVPLIKNTLLNQKFLEDNITIIRNEEATKEGILNAIEELYQKSKPGDIVVIHYSGHGQQVQDDNGDEADGLDESIAPYNAYAFYSKSRNYYGQNHITDDDLEIIINKFRNKLGKDGQLLFILDSCHSGSATRGGKTRGGMPALVSPDWKAPEQNTVNRGSGLFQESKLGDSPAPFVMISGASAEELNYEYEGVGSLSYAFSKAMNELGTDFTYRQLFASISAIMSGIAPKQKPAIEGNVDYKIFKGEYVKQTPYYDVTSVAGDNSVIHINGGQVNSIFKNTTIFVLPAGSTKVEKNKIISTGTVTMSKFGEAVIKLNNALEDDNAKKYWVFIDQPSYSDISVKVFLDKSVADKNIIKGVEDFLAKNNLGEIVTDINSSDIIVDKKGNEYVLSYTKGEGEFNKYSASRGNASDEINAKIFNYAQGTYLKNLSLKNPAYEFEFKLVPVSYDYNTGTPGELLPESDYVDPSGIFQVKPEKDYALLEITNKSNRELYISIVEINTAGEVAPFFPNDGCPLQNQERKLSAGQTMVFRNCAYSFGPPYERLVLKGFASDKPLNFQSTVSTRGTGNANNPLEKFLQGTYNQTRGSAGNTASGALEGYSTEFIYEIVK
ncbi:MAG: caspase family protein [Bacteroidales bacterium]